MKKGIRQALAMILSFVLLFGSLNMITYATVVNAEVKATIRKTNVAGEDIAETNNTVYGIGNPTWNKANTVSTWDCVYFGNYLQSPTGRGSFKKEPIKWRVLGVSGDKALLLADKNLDGGVPYNEQHTSITWEDCTMRTWLNNTFINAAFTSDEQLAIIQEEIENIDNPDYDTSGGNTTVDKIFLPAIGDVTNRIFGFSDSYNESETRIAVNTAYTASKSGMFDEGSSDNWWLRSPGHDGGCAANVKTSGKVISDGNVVTDSCLGVRPALYLNLSSSSWSYAGTVSSDGTSKEAIGGYDVTISPDSYSYDGSAKEPTVSIKGLKAGTDYEVSYTDNINAGTATVTVTGKGNYTGTITKSFTIEPADIENKPASLSQNEYTYDGNAKEPAVTIEGLKKGTDFEVSYVNNINPGTAKVTVTGKGNYKGTITKVFTIQKASENVTPNPQKDSANETPIIKKAKQKVIITSKTKTVKYKNVRKKATYTSAVAVSGAKGTKTFAKVGGSKKLTINKKTGKIKVKKGTRKGTYTIKIKVTSAATANYNAATSAVKTIKVKVK